MTEPSAPGGASPGLAAGRTVSQPVTHLVIMGVAGCGKTTTANGLARVLGWPVAEADDFHPGTNIAKMRAGTPLTDADRWPWLDSLRGWMSERAAQGSSTIVTCSALKRSYRDLLAQAQGRVRFVHLQVQEVELRRRLAQREGHFMPASLLPSQLATLEPLEDDEDGVVVVSASSSPEATVAAVLESLELLDVEAGRC
ncbi:gluconokinase [Actinomyces wuliandei]|uniref:gluconokinase n=1 Tax=Actinomyces wuliandei TaxID=2057743 RepID=UPI000FD9B72C|nr:gluconokinase [Actinomyces wuliandei]